MTREVTPAVAKGFDFRKSGTGLKYGGKRIRRLLKKVDKDTLRASMRATNRSGQWSRTQLLRSLAKVLNVPKRDIAWKEHRAHPKQTRTFYRLTIYRRHYAVEKLKGTRFTPSAGRGEIGTLRLTAYGRRQIFRWVLRKPNGKFYLLRKRGAGGAGSGRLLRRIRGAWLNSNYRESVEIKAELPVRWIREFDRQMLRAKQSRKRR